MSYLDSSTEERVELLRHSEKTANLTRRVTVGSGNLGEAEGAEGDSLCMALSAALGNIGYGSIPAGGAVITNDSRPTVQNSAGGAGIAATPSIVDGAVQNIRLPSTHAIVTTGRYSTIAVTGTFTSVVNMTVTNGIVTAIVLS